jgi:hypothetical protein
VKILTTGVLTTKVLAFDTEAPLREATYNIKPGTFTAYESLDGRGYLLLVASPATLWNSLLVEIPLGIGKVLTDLHAHVETTSRDCDGPMERSRVEEPYDDGESDDEFKGRVMSMFLPDGSDFGDGETYGTDEILVRFTKHGFSWSAPTEEGYRATDVTFCKQDDIKPATQRDVYAESMGY